jgi:phage head maturation protease
LNMTNLNARFYAPLSKIQKQDDGSLRIVGVASKESVDEAGEIIKASAMKKALPDFFKHGTGALRVMHRADIAAGTVDAATTDGDATVIEATIVDAEAIKKTLAGVFKGLSIGGKVIKRNATNRKVIEEINLVEISLVDRPCNGDATFELLKIADAPTIDDALEAMSPEERALVLTKAALKVPLSLSRWGF